MQEEVVEDGSRTWDGAFMFPSRSRPRLRRPRPPKPAGGGFNSSPWGSAWNSRRRQPQQQAPRPRAGGGGGGAASSEQQQLHLRSRLGGVEQEAKAAAAALSSVLVSAPTPVTALAVVVFFMREGFGVRQLLQGTGEQREERGSRKEEEDEEEEEARSNSWKLVDLETVLLGQLFFHSGVRFLFSTCRLRFEFLSLQLFFALRLASSFGVFWRRG